MIINLQILPIIFRRMCFKLNKMAKQIVIDKLKEYKEYKKELGFKKTTALNLGFNTEVEKLNNDIAWVNEIIELINDIDSSK